MADIPLKDRDWKTGEERLISTVDTNLVARNLTPELFARLLSDYMNLGGKQYREGVGVGQLLVNHHRTLQRSEIAFALGIIVGLAEQDLKYTDARNHIAIETAQTIKAMVEKGDLPLGAYI